MLGHYVGQNGHTLALVLDQAVVVRLPGSCHEHLLERNIRQVEHQYTCDECHEREDDIASSTESLGTFVPGPEGLVHRRTWPREVSDPP